MDQRIEHFRTLHQNIWFHVMNNALTELVHGLQHNILWDAWSPMHSSGLYTELRMEARLKQC